MKKHNAKITSKSVEQSGLPSDYKKAIAEYIWNGFDAGATNINIDYNGNELGYLNEFTITDDGKGISSSKIGETFGHFLDSNKTSSYNVDGFIKGKKGKGRFSFSLFCNNVVWESRYREESGEYLEFKISINKSSQHTFDTFENKVSNSAATGTIVHFNDFFDLSSDHLKAKDFVDYLAGEFGWFLYLNKESNHEISINGEPLEYQSIIDDSEDFQVTISDTLFNVSFIRWNVKIGDKYFYYFLNSDKKEVERKHTSFNNKAIDFHHSVYVQSSYFENFKLTETDQPVLGFDGKNQADGTFKALIRNLNQFLIEKEKEFIRKQQAEKLIEDYHSKNIFPKFRSNEYEQLRLKDLENVVREIYCVQPKIFQGLKKEASKTLVGFLNLLLDSEEREKVLDIMEGIVSLSDEERKELADSLRKTKITSVAAIIRLLENRLTVIQILKSLVFDLEPFTNERDHIQQVIENNYWLFGEQYHLVSADKNMETVLSNYLYFLEKGEKEKIRIEEKKRLKRPDVFICRQIDVPDPNSNEYTLEENIIVELKRPSVDIGKDQYRQVEDYMNIIIDEPRFNSQLRKWKFILVGKRVDSFIEGKYESQKNKGKKFLVESVSNYEIYAMTWDDLFKIFDHHHKHLIDNLEFKKSVVEELEEKGFEINRAASDELTRLAVNQ
ncbi:ATP-binding protein [Reichenbachiella carrageenanivorans]|uniref:ATP-binding protein n=1 Tax=Reichenbachiella carrageenanivorans TaxID=2979869 RepID=A0ABY6CYL1_9BACT|nr:ATP-binding protein [Reichenbachiella carrageenanivorans]UXX78997.1 ATP-binding protein [Reichenbachiella carrageenanivorans]